MSGKTRGHAVVLGGSIGGLLAARVLSDVYSDVTVIERDDITGAGVDPRSAVPWSVHIHALLERGRLILEELFPGFLDELIDLGVPVGDYGTTCHYYFNGVMLAEVETGASCVGANRPVIEERIRSKVRALPGVSIRERTDIVGIETDAERERVIGVRVQESGHVDGEQEVVSAELVVDATGRASRTPRWLEELGYGRVPEEKVGIDLTYTTMDFIGPLDNDPLGEDIALVPTATPQRPRGAIFARLSDRYALTLTGIRGDRAPTDREGFLAYTRTLPIPDIHEAVRNARQRSPATSFRFPASVRRRYERLPKLPSGYLVVGDAACVFNPVYAQGMTVAAMGVMVLRDHLEGDAEPDPKAYFRDLSKAIDAPWSMSAAADLAYPGVRGRRTPLTKAATLYMNRVQAAAARDPEVARAFIRTISLIDPPQSLMRPALVGRVLRSPGRPGRRAEHLESRSAP